MSTLTIFGRQCVDTSMSYLAAVNHAVKFHLPEPRATTHACPTFPHDKFWVIVWSVRGQYRLLLDIYCTLYLLAKIKFSSGEVWTWYCSGHFWSGNYVTIEKTSFYLAQEIWLSLVGFYIITLQQCRCESCHGQAERLLDSAREMEDSIAVNLRLA